MATNKVCDLCSNPAIAEVSTKATWEGKVVATEVKVEVCEEHLIEYKQALRVFRGHEKQEDVESPIS